MIYGIQVSEGVFTIQLGNEVCEMQSANKRKMSRILRQEPDLLVLRYRNTRQLLGTCLLCTPATHLHPWPVASYLRGLAAPRCVAETWLLGMSSDCLGAWSCAGGREKGEKIRDQGRGLLWCALG
jgi:hypothetical protein